MWVAATTSFTPGADIYSPIILGIAMSLPVRVDDYIHPDNETLVIWDNRERGARAGASPARTRDGRRMQCSYRVRAGLAPALVPN